MRFFALLNFQHVMLYLFPALIFIVIFGLALAGSYIKRADSAERLIAVRSRYPDGIESKNAPFPVALALIIAGTVVWGVGYIGFTALLGVKI